MTDDDKPAFAQAIARLAIALREKEPDVVQLRIYFEDLRDLDIAFVVEAAHRLERGAEWFPKTSEWRQLADTIRTERLEAQKAQLRAAKQPLCDRCDDTGWERLQLVEHGQPVERVQPCACRDQRWRELTGAAALPALPPKPVTAEDAAETVATVQDAASAFAAAHTMPALSPPERATVVNIEDRRDR